MRRREFLGGLGVVGSVAIAGCGSMESGNESAGERATSTGDADTDRRGTDDGATATREAPTQQAADAHTDSTLQPTTTSTATRTATQTATQAATPDPPANRLLSAGEVGTGWRYADGSAPSERGNGTITVVYVADGTERLQTRLWPCEGDSLAALGGTCSLGNLPERYRAMDGVETATPAVGETAFAWWSGSTTDIEVVANEHVFRTTYSASGSGSDTTATGRLERLTELAGRQATKLGRFA